MNIRKNFGTAGAVLTSLYVVEESHRQRVGPLQRSAEQLRLARWRVWTGDAGSTASADLQLRLRNPDLQRPERRLGLRGEGVAAIGYLFLRHWIAFHGDHFECGSCRFGIARLQLSPVRARTWCAIRMRMHLTTQMWVALWFNPAASKPVPQGAVRPGNAGRGVVRGPGYAKWDVSLFKNIPIHERAQLQLRLETFNTFNHPNPNGIASLNITSAAFGQINSYRDPRLVQIAGKFTF